MLWGYREKAHLTGNRRKHSKKVTCAESCRKAGSQPGGSWDGRMLYFSPGFGNDSLQDKSGLLSVFGNKDLVKHNHTHLFMYCLCICAIITELSSCDKEHMAYRA